MNKKNGSALVRRPSSAVEKAAPGAKRILSGMAADALALAKPVFTVLLCDDQISDIAEFVIKVEWKQKNSLKFIRFAHASELLKLAQQPFDLVFLYVGNVKWDMFTFDFSRSAELLGQLKAQYGKPIIATQGMDLTKEFEETGVIFLHFPFEVEEFRQIVRATLPMQIKGK